MFFTKKSLLAEVCACLSENDASNVLPKLIENSAIAVDQNSAVIKIRLPFYAPAWLTQLQLDCDAKLSELFAGKYRWQIDHHVVALQNDASKSALANIKNIISR